MNSESFVEKIDLISETTFGISKIRKGILKLALQGKLVQQNSIGEPASKLIEKLKKEKVSIGETDNPSDFLPINKSDKPYELPRGWEWVRLGEIGITNIGLTYSPRDINSTGIPVLRSMNIKNGKVVFDELVRVGKEIKKKLMVQVGDIIICARNGSKALVGKSAQIKTLPEPMSFGAFMAVFRCECNPYIEIFLNSNLFRGQLDDANTTTINQLTQHMLRNQLIPLPPLEEQNRIVAKVDQLMVLCEELEAKQGKQTQTRRQLNDAALNALLSAASPNEFEKHWQRIVDNFDLFYDDLENLDSFRQAILDLAFKGKLTLTNKSLELPENWKLGKIGENFEVVTGSTPPTNESSNYSDDVTDCPFFKPTDLNYGLNVKTASSHISAKGEKYCRLIPAKTVSVTCIGATIGKTGLLQVGGTTNQQINSIVPNENFVPEYVYFYCLSNSFQTQIMNNASSTTLPILSKGKFENLTFPVAPLVDQKRIVAKVDQLMTLCDELEKKLTAKSAHLEKLTESLLRV